MISVIIPMYNSERTIIQAVTSIISQTYKGEFEIIVVNDGSTDNGPDILRKFCETNGLKNAKIINQENAGVSSARNAGMKMANGEFIALLDSDDEWLSDKIEEQMNVFQDDPTIDFVGCNRNNEITGFPYNVENGLIRITLRKLLFKTVAQTSTVIFRSSILKEVGYYDEKQRYTEDANYWMRISLKKKMVLLPQSLVVTGGGKASFGASGLSSNLLEMEKGVQKNINEIYTLGEINFVEFCMFKLYTNLKYFRRLLLVKLR